MSKWVKEKKGELHFPSMGITYYNENKEEAISFVWISHAQHNQFKIVISTRNENTATKLAKKIPSQIALFTNVDSGSLSFIDEKTENFLGLLSTEKIGFSGLDMKDIYDELNQYLQHICVQLLVDRQVTEAVSLVQNILPCFTINLIELENTFLKKMQEVGNVQPLIDYYDSLGYGQKIVDFLLRIEPVDQNQSREIKQSILYYAVKYNIPHPLRLLWGNTINLSDPNSFSNYFSAHEKGEVWEIINLSMNQLKSENEQLKRSVAQLQLENNELKKSLEQEKCNTSAKTMTASVQQLTLFAPTPKEIVLPGKTIGEGMETSDKCSSPH